MSRLVKMFLVAAIAIAGTQSGWAAGRWEKALKFTGNYDGSADVFTVSGGLVGSFIRRSVKSSWANEFGTNYSRTKNATSEATYSYLAIAETYVHYLSAFYSWKLYFAVYDGDIDGKTLISDTNLTLGKTFSRYFNANLGLGVKKILDDPTNEAQLNLRLEALYAKSLSYRTKFSFAPAFNFDVENLSNFTIESTILFKYALGKRISLEFNATPGYSSITKQIGGSTKVNFVYDVFLY